MACSERKSGPADPTGGPARGGDAGRALARSGALLLAVLVLALAGCTTKATPTGLIYRVNPPGVFVQALRVDEGGVPSLTLRLANYSTVPMTFAALDLELVLEGAPALRVAAQPALEVPALSSDVVETPLVLTADARTALADAGQSGVLTYRIAGRVTTTRPDGRYPVEFESRLSPVPGRPGEFR